MSTPYISVIVPAFNEEEAIGRSIGALLEQDYPENNYEIIVVDNGSTDRTAEILSGFPVKVIPQTERSSYKARNIGIREAQGEYIAFTDADCIADKSWLSELMAFALTNDLNCVAGRIENIIEKNNFANKLLKERCSAEQRRSNVVDHDAASAGNVLVRKETFSKYGMFESVLSGGDIEFSRRIKSRGEEIGYAEKALVRHLCDLSDMDYVLRSFRIREGQELLNLAEPKHEQLKRVLLAFPWRPGISRAKALSREIEESAVFLFFYLWIERLAAYFGAIRGAILSKRRDV